MRLVLVEWLDSFGCGSSWAPLETVAPEPHRCRSVGWLLHDGPECKVVIPHVAESPPQGLGDITIPVCAITRLVDLIESPAAA